MEKPNQCAKYGQISRQRRQTDINEVVLVSLILTVNRFHTFLGVSIVDFRQTNDGCRVSFDIDFEAKFCYSWSTVQYYSQLTTFA